MFRPFTRIAAASLAILLLSSGVVRAEEKRSDEPVAPSAAVAAAWAKEQKSSPAIRTLYASYGVAQGLDMLSTVVARNRGAIEANPTMQGSYAKGVAVKAAMGAATMLAVRSMEKRHPKAAVFTMIALNVATGAVVANNMRNAGRVK